MLVNKEIDGKIRTEKIKERYQKIIVHDFYDSKIMNDRKKKKFFSYYMNTTNSNFILCAATSAAYYR